MITKIMSGGQTGADQAGLVSAKANNIETGGWVPPGYITEDGPNTSLKDYNLQQIARMANLTAEYRARTSKNVRDSDGTVVFTYGEPTGGSRLTINVCDAINKPFIHIDLNLDKSKEANAMRIKGFINSYSIDTLNVAGSRESKAPGIHKRVVEILNELLMDETKGQGARDSSD